MSSTTESRRLNDILKWEPENLNAREKMTVLSGQDLAVGAVIGKIMKTQAAAPVPARAANPACRARTAPTWGI